MRVEGSTDGFDYPKVPVSRLVGHEEGPIPLVQFTPDGKYCLTAGSDRTIRLWNPSRLDPAYPAVPFVPDNDISISSLPPALPIQKYSFRHTPSSITCTKTRLFAGCNKAGMLIDIVSTSVLRQFHGHSAAINDVAILEPKGPDVLATASYDTLVNIWDNRSSNVKPIQTLGEAKDSVSVVRYYNNSILTASVDGCLRNYDLRMGQLFCDNYHSPITSLDLSKGIVDTTLLAVSCLDGTIRLVNPDDSRSKTLSIKLLCKGSHKAGQYGLQCRFSADETTVVSGSEDGRAVLYDVSNRGRREATERLALVGHTAPTCSVGVHPDQSDVVITASYDGNCVVWANRNDYMKWEG